MSEVAVETSDRVLQPIQTLPYRLKVRLIAILDGSGVVVSAYILEMDFAAMRFPTRRVQSKSGGPDLEHARIASERHADGDLCSLDIKGTVSIENHPHRIATHVNVSFTVGH